MHLLLTAANQEGRRLASNRAIDTESIVTDVDLAEEAAKQG